MARKNVYVTRRIPEPNLDALREQFDVEVNPEDRALTHAELKEKVKGRDAVVSVLTDTIDGEVLDAAGPQLKIVANYAVGFNNFDIKAATERGVILTNTPGVLDDATATLAISLMLSIARRIPEAESFLRAGKWEGWGPLQFLGLDVDGKTLGVAGAGRIGQNVARKAKAFGMRILYTGATRKDEFEKAVGATWVDKATLLRESDFVTLHMQLMPETRHYIGAAELAAMKKTAVLINTARGPVVDEAALVVALRERQIWGAALDVFEAEPKLAAGLAELDNLVIVPHIASATFETRTRMGAIAVTNVLKVMRGMAPDTCVNPGVLKDLEWRR